MRLRLIKNKYFESYINKRCKRESRWDSLDLDDITTDIDVPSQSEIDSAVRELEILDDAAIETGFVPTVDPGTGTIELDFDDKKPKKKPGRPSKKLKMKSDDTDDLPVRELDLDNGSNKSSSKSDTDSVRELDLDSGVTNTNKKDSNIGSAIGNLDYDADIDTSNLIASIDDVYVGLASSNGEVVQGLIKRYANDLTDVERLKEIMLTHAIQGNYDSLRSVCGDMRITLTAKEKELGYIDKSDVDKILRKLRKIARSLTGANNTYGLIPNAIANCNPNSQIEYINIVDFLYEILGMSLQPIYYRGAFLMHCYDLADYILDELDEIPVELLFGKNGLIKRSASYTDIPSESLRKLISSVNIKQLKSSDIGELLIMCIDDDKCVDEIKKAVKFTSVKGDLVLSYLEDNGRLTDAQIAKLTD